LGPKAGKARQNQKKKFLKNIPSQLGGGPQRDSRGWELRRSPCVLRNGLGKILQNDRTGRRSNFQKNLPKEVSQKPTSRKIERTDLGRKSASRPRKGKLPFRGPCPKGTTKIEYKVRAKRRVKLEKMWVWAPVRLLTQWELLESEGDNGRDLKSGGK